MNREVIDAVWSTWDPKAYLQDFYQTIDADELETMAFLSEVAKHIKPGKKLLDFGCGPTLHHIFPFVPQVSQIDVADLLDSNLKEIGSWADRKKNAHNWDDFIAYTLRCESGRQPTIREVRQRRLETRRKLGKRLVADAGDADPLGKRARGTYATVISCYCADSATTSKKEFARYVTNIMSLVKPGGTFVLACLRNTTYYRVSPLEFPSANVDERLVRKVLSTACIPASISIQVRDVPSHEQQGYTSIILSYASKRPVE